MILASAAVPDFPLGDEWSRAAQVDVARMDNAFWAAELRKPFTWQRFLNWWVARRWIDTRHTSDGRIAIPRKDQQ